MKRAIAVSFCLGLLLACQDIQSQKEIIETTRSGFRYSILQDAPGEPAQPGQYVLVHTVMAHQDSVLSDTRQNPGRPTVVHIEDDPDKRKGSSGPVQDLLELLSVGDSARLYYPVDSFASKPKRLAGFKEVTYDIKVIDVLKSEDELKAHFEKQRAAEEARKQDFARKEAEMTAIVTDLYKQYKDGKLQLSTTESGLQYVILEKSGTGVKAPAGTYVRTQYYGILEADGMAFDNSYKRGETFDFVVGTDPVIDGWHEAFQILEKGDKGLIVVPPSLAWGDQGFGNLIPPNSTVIFYVELVGIGEME